MKKVMLVFGTRPEAIKMCPLVKEFQKDAENFKTIVCVTGQHREMLDQVLTIFDVKPDYDLNIMKQGQDLYDVTARVILGMRDVLKEAQPDGRHNNVDCGCSRCVLSTDSCRARGSGIAHPQHLFAVA